MTNLQEKTLSRYELKKVLFSANYSRDFRLRRIAHQLITRHDEGVDITMNMVINALKKPL